MWQRYLLVFSLIHCLLVLCQASNDCQIPTDKKEVSICSYCSGSHAGVRWRVHPSILDWNSYPDGPFRLIIRFRCNNTLHMIDKTRDACFNGAGLPRLVFLTDASVWRWHILGQSLPEGTQCQFTAEVEDGYTLTLHRLQMSTSCTIGGNDNSVMPATCSESTAPGCPCQCNEGFRTDPGEVDSSLTCKNIDECSEGIHNCINASDCVDTEGGYYCINETTVEPPTASPTLITVTPSSTLEPPTTITRSISSIEMFPSSTLIKVTPNSTISNTNPSPTTTAYSSTNGTEITTAFTTQESSTSAFPVTEIEGTGKSISNDIILGIVLGIVLLIVFVTIVVMISISITQKNLYLQRNKSMIKRIPKELAIDPFDPDFCPVVVEKSDLISIETMSLKSIFDPLYDSHNAPSTNGSVITLNIDELN